MKFAKPFNIRRKKIVQSLNKLDTSKVLLSPISIYKTVCGMEFNDGPMRTFGVTVTSTNVLFYSLCFMTACIHSAVDGKALSQAPDLSSSSKPMIYIDIPSWENRTAYPRFLIYRDHIRRRLDNSDSRENNENDRISSYSKPTNSSASSSSAILIPYQQQSVISTVSSEEVNKDSSDDTSSSVEQLLAEQKRNGVIPSELNAKTEDNANRKPVPNEPNAKSVMDTQATLSDKQIVFPKDKTNPCNRLQINPDEEENASSSNESTKGSSQQGVSAEDENISFEIGNRENFSNGNDKKEGKNMTVHLIKDAIPTFQLTMKIIEQSRWNDENVIFSPLSIANVLSMMLLGAGGETFNELLMLLGKQEQLTSSQYHHPTWTANRYHEAYKRLMKYLKTNSGSGVTLTSASEIFVDESFPVSDKFQRDLLNFYEAPLEAINFGKDGYAFMDKLNKWVREKTQNQIQSILTEPPEPETTMGIINAIHFKGPWVSPFSEKLTRWRDFRVQPKEKIKAQMMINILNIPYIDRDLYRMTAVPYKENKTALILILPKGNDGLADLKNVEKALTRQELNDSISLMKETKIALTLPKLKFSSDGQMVKNLQNMGLSSVFEPRKANFSSISPAGLYISGLLHRAVIEINEKGTEASAVTLGTADRIFDDPPIPFGCDKPFLFFIYHVHADTILFWGRVVRPSSEP